MNKIFEYLASGRWLVMGAEVPHNPVSGAPGAVITAPNAQALAEALHLSYETPHEERKALASGNIEFAKQRYDFGVTARTLSDALMKLV